jgi:glycosyltransferase involved in cell wall biosynthesis
MVVLVDEGPRRDVRGLYALSEESDGPLRVIRLSYRPSTATIAFLPGVLAVARRLRREGTPVDLLHAHVHWMAWVATLAGAVLRRPVVITEHSTEWPDRRITPGALRRARIAFRRAAVVCPVSLDLQRAIERYGIKARFRVVPNTVNTRIFYPLDKPNVVAPTKLINVGLQIERKRLDVLLRAFAKVAGGRPELRLDLLGEGPLTPELKRLAVELNVGERVRFPGARSPRDIANALRAADVFVLSSVSETGPIVVLEALCCGLPVATTEVGSAPEAVGSDGALARPGDVDGLAAAIEVVLQGYDRFDRVGIAGRCAARASFEAVGRTWDEIYRSV